MPPEPLLLPTRPPLAVDPADPGSTLPAIAEVALDLPRPALGPRPLSAGFHYRIPSQLLGLLRPGQAVWVPFGRRDMAGVVLDLGSASPVERLRDIAALIDPLPLIDPRDIDLARWLAEEAYAPLFDCLRLFLPPGGLPAVEEVYRRSGRRPKAEELRGLSPAAARLLGLLQVRGEARTADLAAEGLRQPATAAAPLLRAGLISVELRLAPARAAPRQRIWLEGPLTEARDLDALLAGLRPQPKADLLALLRRASEAGEAPALGEALAASAGQRADLRALEREGLVRRLAAADEGGERLAPAAEASSASLLAAERRFRRTEGAVRALSALLAAGGRLEEREVLRLPAVTAKGLRDLAAWRLVDRVAATAWRDPLAEQDIPPDSPLPFTADQAAAWEQIRPLLAPPPPGKAPPQLLIRGVTGSGKTELYLRAIAEVLAEGRQAVVLVPEISLTPQTLRRFAARFPGRVGVWHSRLSEGERADTWRRARQGLLDVIVGSRSALLSPLPRLGLVVVDECHAGGYKQGQTPRYHAVQLARERAARWGATLILGSATPSVEQSYEVEQGRMRGLVLGRRVDQGQGGGLPPVRVVDMRAELKAGNTSLFSLPLREALADIRPGGSQAMLFLNRRGSASYVFCRDCGEALCCPRCRLPLTWHQGVDRLVCHHCNHREVPARMCPHCASPRIRQFGAGTEKVEEALHRDFPALRVLRWDADTTARKGSHEAILAAFIAGEAEVLVGTQMIAKGLDLPRVTLVGIVSADTGLQFPDFRAAEQAFQILTQVAGRAGRGEAAGQVILQTYQPEHPAIQFAAAHDYPGFYRHELAFRRAAGYPPFSRLTRLLYVTESGAKAAQAAAEKLAAQLEQAIARLGLADTSLIGPAPAYFARLGGQHRWQILLRGPDPHSLLAALPPGPGWRVDVDAVDVL